ncbi:AIR synthase family protein [Parasediminibacterium sp. JCM 36343]|uniref:AIR synthase family protein n=1 Tax=Parasediminibacterium sp. JCM 36343 TaxID=3374279 RepID=UPI00397D5325
MSSFPDAGKIQEGFFSEVIFPNCGKQRPEVLVGSQYGVDVSVIQLPGGMAMALTSDPLTLIPSLGLRESAWLSVQILANDMVTTGFAPMYAQFVLNLPTTVNTAQFKEYWQHVHGYCEEIGIAITGGHTGQVVGQNSTVAGGGTMITVAPETSILTSNKAKAGNMIIVTKSAALTASSVLAMSFPETVTAKAGKEVWQQGCEAFYQTSSLQDGLVAALASEGCTEVTAMHDVTEGGVLGAIYEMATAANCGVMVDNDKIPVGEVQKSICNIFHLDPRYVVGAGSIIIAAKAETAGNVLNRLQEKNIEAVVVGHFTENTEGKILLSNDDKKQPLTHPGLDAYWDTFYNAFAEGWK